MKKRTITTFYNDVLDTKKESNKILEGVIFVPNRIDNSKFIEEQERLNKEFSEVFLNTDRCKAKTKEGLKREQNKKPFFTKLKLLFIKWVKDFRKTWDNL